MGVAQGFSPNISDLSASVLYSRGPRFNLASTLGSALYTVFWSGRETGPNDSLG